MVPPTAASRPSSAIAPGRAGSVVRRWVPSWMQPFLVLSGNQNTSWGGGGGEIRKFMDLVRLLKIYTTAS